MNDDRLISLNAAIDALEKVADLFPWKVLGNRDSYDRYNEAWNDAIGRAEIEIEKLPPAQQWIPVTPKTLPKTEEKVLVTCEHLDIYGKPHRYVCKAYHVDRYTMRSDVDWWDEGCDEYREEDDQYYVLEGWYEYIHNWGDYSSVCITEDKVVAWMPLPEPWKGEPDEH